MKTEKDYEWKSYQTPLDDVRKKEKKSHYDTLERIEKEVRAKAIDEAKKKIRHGDIKDEEKMNELIEEKVKDFKERLGLDVFRQQIDEVDKAVVSVIEKKIIPLRRKEEEIEDFFGYLQKTEKEKKTLKGYTKKEEEK